MADDAPELPQIYLITPSEVDLMTFPDQLSACLDVAEVAARIGAVETAARESVSSVEPVPAEDVVQRWFAENAHVFLNPGDGFGTGGGDHMRMNIGTPRAILQRALDNMAEALAEV